MAQIQKKAKKSKMNKKHGELDAMHEDKEKEFLKALSEKDKIIEELKRKLGEK